MDYKRKLIQIVLVILVAINIISCTGEADSDEPQIAPVELSREPIQLIGRPASKLYYGAIFDTSFSIVGGSGQYDIAYDPNPETDPNEVFDDNHLKFTIQKTESKFETSFRLQGIIDTPEDIDFEDLNNMRITFQILINDGHNEEKFPFEVRLEKNKLRVSNASDAINEGIQRTDKYNTLENSYQQGVNGICDNFESFKPSPKEINGKFVYPQIYQVGLNVPVQNPVKIGYTFESSYNEDLEERSAKNAGTARPEVDFIIDDGVVKEIELGKGDYTCMIPVYIVDDYIVESNESFRLKFFAPNNNESGRIIDLSNTYTLTITDNEPDVSYEPSSQVINEGDSVDFTFSLNRLTTSPIEMNISTEDENTTADLNDYQLVPHTGKLTIKPGSSEGKVTLQISENVDEVKTEKDEEIYVHSDLSVLENLREDTVVKINEWVKDLTVLNDTDGSSEIVDMTINGGVISTLSKVDINGLVSSRISSFYRDGSRHNHVNGTDYDLSSDSISITPVAILSNSTETSQDIYVVANVDKLFADVHRGGIDFVVAKFSRNGFTPYELKLVKQFGSNGDDNVSGATLNDDMLFVYGQTGGSMFEGVGPIEASFGKLDGFIYKISIDSLLNEWAIFTGTEEDDRVIGIDVVQKELTAVIDTQYGSRDGLVKKYYVSTGIENKLDDSNTFISSFEDDFMIATTYDGRKSGFSVLFHSEGDTSTASGQTPSLSQDVFLANFSAQNTEFKLTRLSSAENDYASDVKITDDGEHIVVGGYTQGTFANNSRVSEGHTDAFVSIFPGTHSISAAQDTDKTLQFGLSKDDKVIDIEIFNDDKFMVLWSSHDATLGSTDYKLSAFSIDGRKLSAY